MTPLVAGIALTGKAPVYEKVYMSGLKQKAAGEAAAAKQRAKAEEDIEKSINIDYSKYHYSMQKLVKEKAAKAVSEMRNAIAEDNVRGINRANDIKRELLIDLAGMSNASNQLFEREKPTYTSTYIRPEATFRALNSKDIREAVKDPAVLQELEDYGWNITVDPNNRVAINFSDIKSFDVRKAYNTFQGDVIEQVAPQLAEKFKVGRTTRQELSQAITKEMSDDYLTSISADPSAVFNWKKQYGVDIRTDDGKQKVYDLFLSPERTGVTDSGRSTYIYSPGSLSSKEATVSPLDSSADASYGWSVFAIPGKQGRFQLKNAEGLIAKREDGENMEFANSQDALNWKDKNSKKTLSGEALQVGYEASSLVPKDGFYIGEKTSGTKFGERVSGNTVSAKVTRIETIPVYTGTENKQYGLFVLKPGDPVLKEVLDIDPSIKNEKRLFVVAEGGRIVRSGGNERVTGATMYLPATKANLGAVLKGIPTSDKALRGQIEKIIKGEKFGGAGVVGAATKGAETQPKSGFSLLQFDTFA